MYTITVYKKAENQKMYLNTFHNVLRIMRNLYKIYEVIYEGRKTVIYEARRN